MDREQRITLQENHVAGRDGEGARELEALAAAHNVDAVGTALRWGRTALLPSPTAGLDAALLLGHLLGRDRAWLIAHPEAPLGATTRSDYADLIARRREGTPVAYLRGTIEWYGTEFAVTPDVLVPRPETELLLERAVAVARSTGAQVLADIGTGSGVLAVHLARNLVRARIYAIDVNLPAVELARRNALSHGVAERVSVLRGHLLDPLPERPELIVANLPYLSDEMMASLGADVRHEPELALHGGPTGLELYEDLLAAVASRQWRIPLLLEIDSSQTRAIQERVGKLLPDSTVEIELDYAGLPRIAVVLPRMRPSHDRS